jgi:predicted extracellular nuclease
VKPPCIRAFAAVLTLAFTLGLIPLQYSTAAAGSSSVVISEFRVRGPNGGNDEFIELYNLSTAPVDIGGWKINGSNNAGATTTRAVITSGVTLGSGCHYLLTDSGATGGPYSGAVAGDQTYATGIADDGGIALLTDLNAVVDQVGMSNTSAYKEGTPLASLGSVNADQGYERRPGGAAGSSTDTDDNSHDFQLISPSDPQNFGSPCVNLGGPDTAPSVSSTLPGSGASGVALDANLSISFSEPVAVSGTWYSISCASTGAHTASVSGGPVTFQLNPDVNFAFGETCSVTIAASQVTDIDTNDPPDAMVSDYSWSFTAASLPGTPTLIHTIQGAGHTSPLLGQTLDAVTGIVTAKRSNGFYLQDPLPDADDATSEGIFVYASSAPTVSVGDLVAVKGTVSEYRAVSGDLSTTELTAPTVTVYTSGNPLPAPIVLGAGGRVPPAAVIEDDAADVEAGGTFDPASDGIDFYESLEGMRVQVNDALAVGPTSDFGSNREIPVVGDLGANAWMRNPRGGLTIRPDDFNPERIILNDLISGGPGPLPPVNVGASFPGAIVGVIDYSYSSYKLQVTALPSVNPGTTAKEVTTPAGFNEVTVATFNVENLAPTDPASKFSRLGGLIVTNLQSPDLLAVEEVQDNSGATDDGTVAADTTWGKLIAAIQAAGGPTYQYRQIDPENDQDGGAPGGNIRVGFLFRTDRGLSFVDRPGAGSLTPNQVVPDVGGAHLLYNPGRVEPTSPAFASSRKPLAGEFLFHGHRFFAIANHFNSKGGDQPLFGRYQPPALASETQRIQQAQIVHDFVQSILTADPAAGVVVLGDLNDYQFSPPLTTLKGTLLHDLIEGLPESERYTYVYEGNSEALDHLLISNPLLAAHPAYDVVHVNAEFADQASDHDPQVARIPLNAPPAAEAGGPYEVISTGSVTLSASGADPEGGSLSYAWDLDNDGTFETPGQSVRFRGVGLTVGSIHTVRVQVTDSGGLTAVDTAAITVTQGFPVYLSLVWKN